MEEWREVEGFPGYRISNTGKVASCVNNRHGLCDKYHELRQRTSKRGYKSVQLGRKHRKSVHQLVATAYISNPHGYRLVRHLDDNPQNNNVDNLAWGTQKHNMEDCVRHGRLVGDTTAAIRAKSIRVIAKNISDGRVQEFPSIHEAARSLNLWPQHVHSVLRGKIKQTGGWTFKEVDTNG